LLALISILATFACYRRRGANDAAAAVIYLVAAVAIGTCLFHLLALAAFGDMSLVFDWWYFMLLPLVALAFCAAFGDLIEGNRRTAFLALVGTVIAANLVLSHLHLLKLFLFQNTQYVSYVVVGLLAVFLMLSRHRASVAGAMAAVALSLQAANSSLMRYHYFATLEDERGLTRAAEGAFNVIMPTLAEKPVVWIADTDNHGLDLPIFRAMIRCSYEKTFPEKLPDPLVNWQEPLAPGRTLVVIDGNAAPVSEIQAALARHGMSLDVVASQYFWRIEGKEPGVQVTIGKVR
jgi:hypothetical protein